MKWSDPSGRKTKKTQQKKTCYTKQLNGTEENWHAKEQFGNNSQN